MFSLNEENCWKIVVSPTMGRVDSQVDRKVADALVPPCHTICLVLDLLHDRRKFHKLLSLGVEEFSILHWTVY